MRLQGYAYSTVWQICFGRTVLTTLHACADIQGNYAAWMLLLLLSTITMSTLHDMHRPRIVHMYMVLNTCTGHQVTGGDILQTTTADCVQCRSRECSVISWGWSILTTQIWCILQLWAVWQTLKRWSSWTTCCTEQIPCQSLIHLMLHPAWHLEDVICH